MLDSPDFITAMRQVPTPVSIVTTNGEFGPAGATVSAVCSLSAEPPSVLVCLHRRGRLLSIIEEHGTFCVNFIANHHKELALAFARPQSDNGKRSFASEDWDIESEQPLPVLKSAIAHFECLHLQTTSFGTHNILIGKVENAGYSSSEPVVYQDGKFVALQR